MKKTPNNTIQAITTWYDKLNSGTIYSVEDITEIPTDLLKLLKTGDKVVEKADTGDETTYMVAFINQDNMSLVHVNSECVIEVKYEEGEYDETITTELGGSNPKYEVEDLSDLTEEEIASLKVGDIIFISSYYGLIVSSVDNGTISCVDLQSLQEEARLLSYYYNGEEWITLIDEYLYGTSNIEIPRIWDMDDSSLNTNSYNLEMKAGDIICDTANDYVGTILYIEFIEDTSILHVLKVVGAEGTNPQILIYNHLTQEIEAIQQTKGTPLYLHSISFNYASSSGIGKSLSVPFHVVSPLSNSVDLNSDWFYDMPDGFLISGSDDDGVMFSEINFNKDDGEIAVRDFEGSMKYFSTITDFTDEVSPLN